MRPAADVIRILGLEPHPEGGHFRETFRDAAGRDGRAYSTAIYYLLSRGERSRWHCVDAAELRHFHTGAPLRLEIAPKQEAATAITLGIDLVGGERPQAVVPAGVWQRAESHGDWSLVSCTVAPGFQFEGFEMAPKGWEPPKLQGAK